RKQQIFSNVEGDVVRQKQAMEFIQSKQFEEFVLNEMINTLVISKFLKENGVDIKPQVIAGYVRNMATFQKEGKFDAVYFKQYLKYLNMNEYDFLKQQIPEIEQNVFGQLLSVLQIGEAGHLQEEYAKALKRERGIEVLTLNVPVIKKPTDDELNKFYQIHKEKFIEKPQHYVTVSYIDDYISKHTNVFHATPSMIANYYNDSYMGKVMKLYYVEIADEGKANIIHSITTKQGISLQSAVETMLKKPVHHIQSNGFASSNDIDDARIISAIRDLNIGNITPIIKIDSKLYIAQIIDIQEEEFLNRESSKAINNEIMHQRKCNNVKVYTEKLRQEFESGVSFDTVSLKYGLPISASIVVDENDGKVRNEQNGKPIIISQKLVEHVLSNNDTLYGNILNINEKTCSFVVYKQERITKERIKTLPEVRGEILQMYEAWKISQDTKATAENILQQVTSLKTDLSGYISYGAVLKRQVQLSDAIGSEVFAKSIGDVFIYNNGTNLQIIRIMNEKHYDGNVTEQDIHNNAQNLQNAYYNSFLKELINKLYKEYKVKRMI
ncbi:MAG: SurA N-terminal domain-containing protein, partial [Proteobacteria bacterium]|nr:SurA N-terminal domain-containing protein [Pseudomonadota bacterium]